MHKYIVSSVDVGIRKTTFKVRRLIGNNINLFRYLTVKIVCSQTKVLPKVVIIFCSKTFILLILISEWLVQNICMLLFSLKALRTSLFCSSTISIRELDSTSSMPTEKKGFEKTRFLFIVYVEKRKLIL